VVIQENPEFQEFLERMEYLDSLEKEDHQERWDLLGPLAHRALLGPLDQQESQVQLENLEFLADLEFLENQEGLGNLEKKDQLVLLVRKESLDPLEHQDSLVSLENVDFLDYRACLASKEKVVLRDPLDHRVTKDNEEIQVWKGHPEWRGELDLPDRQESLEKRVKLVFLDFLDQLVGMAFLEQEDCLVYQVHREILERME
jgi:hypothetical protein